MLVTIREHEYLRSIEKSNWKIDSLTSSIGWLLSIIAFYSSVAAADNHDEEEIIFPFKLGYSKLEIFSDLLETN